MARASSTDPALVVGTNRVWAKTVWESESMLFSVQVEVALRPGIAEPQGSTIERSLPTLGFDGIRDVRVGKSIRFTIESADEAAALAEVDDLCARFLTNPVIEDAVVKVEPASVEASDLGIVTGS
jgi:phosphoribosylformylglycinamidine synthase